MKSIIFPRKLHCHDCQRKVDAETANEYRSFLYCVECDSTILDDDSGEPMETDGDGGLL